MNTFKITAFADIKNIMPFGSYEAEQIEEAIKSPNSKHVPRVIEYRKTKNPEIKESLPVVTWNGVFARREASGLVYMNSNVYIDIDEVENVEKAKRDLSKLPYTRLVWKSVSGEKLGAVIAVSNLKVKTFSKQFEQIRSELSDRGFKLDNLSDISRANFVSYDPEIYSNRIASNLMLDSISVEAEKENSNHHEEYLTTGYGDYIDRCRICYSVALRNKGIFQVGNRSNFTVSFIGCAINFGIPKNVVFKFLSDNMLVYYETIVKLEYMYERYGHTYGIYCKSMGNK